MTKISVSRRRFMQTAAVASTAILPLFGRATAPAGTFLRADLTLADGRFDRAVKLASGLAAGGTLRTVGGDPSAVATWFEQAARRGTTLRVRGVTLESIPFCLSSYAPRGRLEIHRLDRDLFVWELTHG